MTVLCFVMGSLGDCFVMGSLDDFCDGQFRGLLTVLCLMMGS